MNKKLALNLRLLTAHLAQRLSALMPGELDAQDMVSLLYPRFRVSLIGLRRAQMIANRVRLMALLFAVLTPLWSILDFLFFPFPLWFALALMRISAGIAFALLALPFLLPHGRSDHHITNAYRALAMLFVIPAIFYFASQEVLFYYHLQGFPEAIKAGYAYLPFVLLAGISIFPLSLIESLLITMPLLLIQAISGLYTGPMLGWPSFVGAFWLQVLITGVATLSGMSQLAFMIALLRQAVRDPLTGIFSRRGGEELLERQVLIALRNRAPLSIAFVDLDHFKEVNDRYGHEEGDKVLMGAAAVMTKSMRLSDILVRWGGEEFVIIMPDTDTADATQALNRLREEGFGERPDGSRMTASIGYAEVSRDRSINWRELVEAADRRMYLAKEAGRDCVVYDDSPIANGAAKLITNFSAVANTLTHL